jgi:hypothetical protein
MCSNTPNKQVWIGVESAISMDCVLPLAWQPFFRQQVPVQAFHGLADFVVPTPAFCRYLFK